MSYRAPVKEMTFYLDNVLDAGRISETDKFAEATGDMTEAILGEAARLSEEILAPLNVAGDLHPARLEMVLRDVRPDLVRAIKRLPRVAGLVWLAILNLAVWDCRWR